LELLRSCRGPAAACSLVVIAVECAHPRTLSSSRWLSPSPGLGAFLDLALLQVVGLEQVADCLGDLLEAVAPAATSATVAPSAASARAVSAPMPLLAAVMSATVFSRRLGLRL
jgi:hypothetical protein